MIFLTSTHSRKKLAQGLLFITVTCLSVPAPNLVSPRVAHAQSKGSKRQVLRQFYGSHAKIIATWAHPMLKFQDVDLSISDNSTELILNYKNKNNEIIRTKLEISVIDTGILKGFLSEIHVLSTNNSFEPFFGLSLLLDILKPTLKEILDDPQDDQDMKKLKELIKVAIDRSDAKSLCRYILTYHWLKKGYAEDYRKAGSCDSETVFNMVERDIIANKNISTNFNSRCLAKSHLRLLRNTVFARHGMQFKDDVLRSHFAKKSWYSINSSYSHSLLTEMDKKNVNLIKVEEDSR